MPLATGIMADSYNKPASGGPLAGYVAWFDADDASSFTYHSGTVVYQWNDKSGYHVTQGYIPWAPTRNGTQNGKATVVYSGAQQGLERASPFAAVTDNFTMFAVFKKIGTDNDGRTLFANGSTGNGCAIASTAYSAGNVGFLIGGVNWYNGGRPYTAGAHQVVVLRRTSGVWSMYSNGVAGTITGSPGGISTPSAASISNSTHPFIGEVAELLFYSSALSDPNRIIVETYLKTKWGTP